mmetsp:Transcript_70473/g.178259  ORF Transcript_70473/g.178259 Transcript_70473/m.178259 type:complete len:251 (-) Transcript_70473:3-755(-)
MPSMEDIETMETSMTSPALPHFFATSRKYAHSAATDHKLPSVLTRKAFKFQVFCMNWGESSKIPLSNTTPVKAAAFRAYFRGYLHMSVRKVELFSKSCIADVTGPKLPTSSEWCCTIELKSASLSMQDTLSLARPAAKASNCCFAAAPLDLLRPMMCTRAAPYLMNSCAAALPMPWVPPVIRTLCPEKGQSWLGRLRKLRRGGSSVEAVDVAAASNMSRIAAIAACQRRKQERKEREPPRATKEVRLLEL